MTRAPAIDPAIDPAVDPAIDPAIEERLTAVYDPCCRDKGISVVDMGLLHRAHVGSDGHARVELLLTSGWCPFAATVLTEIRSSVESMPGVTSADVEIVWERAWSTDRLAPAAREKLRFLPPPTTAGDPAAYVEKHWTTGQPAVKEQ
ncbi:Metal-sulfur cluster biosynthetic enzyme [Pedococcus cremeus]|uniref:Metal-sulfur cluster biosynthetic enzyme n=1 Tax=Pedococcus cremeus TaxID=587636 RepID=A0A1H9QI46_9MICO|nr:iron-sulfur cluster assembly protein [Pedococcus cremeus]SER60098.1 Metal-sulfur cluster biosynthetic enzyme [Pedococcus cremeus]